MGFMRRFLSPRGKIAYDMLYDYSLWWRHNKYSMWVETRDVRYDGWTPETPDDLSIERMEVYVEYGMWPHHDKTSPMMFWIGNGWSFMSRCDPSFNVKKYYDYPSIDRFILYKTARKRIRKDKGGSELQTIRSLKGENRSS